MRTTIENASAANNSTSTSRVTNVNRPPTPVRADITGTRSNKYLFSLRKAVREFLAEDAKGYLNAIYRFNSKVEAARLLFPEDRAKLHHCYSYD